MLKVFLELPVLLEQPAYLVLIVLEYLTPLIVEGLLNVVELVAVVGAHLIELKLHRCDQEVDVVVLVLQRVHILIVLGLQLLHELADETLLLLNDLGACVFLLVDILMTVIEGNKIPWLTPHSLLFPRDRSRSTQFQRFSCDL